MKLSAARRLRAPFAFGLAVLLVGMSAITVAQQQGGPELNPGHPERYVVKRGDTLWDISAMFLRNPWYWPEIWYVNPQVENPHLIYPGDVLTLVYVDGRPQLRMERAAGTERLSPRVREQSLDEAVTTIPYNVIAPFLSRAMVLEKDEIRGLPHIVALRDGHLVGAEGNDLYVRGQVGAADSAWHVVHIGEELVDPDDGDVVGYEGVYIGEGRIRRGGDPATLRLTASSREALKGDRLIQPDASLPLQFVPRAPEESVDGRIIHVIDGVSMIGQYQVVVINRGARHGLEQGHVLGIWQAGETVRDRQSGSALTRSFGEKVQLPDEKAGVAMLFKTYDRISYALVMQAEGPIRKLDKVRNPT